MPSARLIIDHTSSLNTSGTSRSEHGSHVGQGGSFIGQGGSCGTKFVDKTYGQFDMKPKSDGKLEWTTLFEGSVGDAKKNDTTGAGGRIYLDIDSFYLSGNGHQI